MMKYKIDITKLFLTWLILFGCSMLLYTGCSDDPVSGTRDEAPLFPDFDQIQMDVSYFTQRPPYKMDANAVNENAYPEAYTYAVNAANLLNVYGASGFVYFGLAELAQPDFADNIWNWTYSYQTQGVFTEMKLTSKAVSSGYEWNLYLTMEITNGESINNLKFMNGFTSSDGNSGNWSLFPAYEGSTTPILEFTWDRRGETEMELGYKIFAESSSSQVPIFEVNYKGNSPDYEIQYLNREDNWQKDIYWNTNTLSGYIVEDGVKSCWNQDLETIDCN